MATLLLPTSGYVNILGYDLVKEADKIRSFIAYLAEDAGTYRNLSGREYLSIVARIYFDSNAEASKAVEEAISISGLGERIDDKMKTYSKGMKRRLQVARVLMTKPKLAILDEPTAGLDVFHAKYLREIVMKYVEGGVERWFFQATICLRSNTCVPEWLSYTEGISFLKESRRRLKMSSGFRTSKRPSSS